MIPSRVFVATLIAGSASAFAPATSAGNRNTVALEMGRKLTVVRKETESQNGKYKMIDETLVSGLDGLEELKSFLGKPELKTAAEKEDGVSGLEALEELTMDWEKMFTSEQESHKEALETIALGRNLHFKDLQKFDRLINYMEATIEAERELLLKKLAQAQETTNTILQNRIQTDAELNALRQKFEIESKKWEKDILAYRKEVFRLSAELGVMKNNEKALEAERGDVGALLGQAFKVMFGLP